MIVRIVAVGRTRGPLADAVSDYENRARRYWKLETVEVTAGGAAKSASPEHVRAEEGTRILKRLGAGQSVVALTRAGRTVASTGLADILQKAAVNSVPAVTFVIGGAFGLSNEVLSAASHHMALSGMTLPHEMARLVLTEQIYRAGTIVRGEPYHKGRS